MGATKRGAPTNGRDPGGSHRPGCTPASVSLDSSGLHPAAGRVTYAVSVSRFIQRTVECVPCGTRPACWVGRSDTAPDLHIGNTPRLTYIGSEGGSEPLPTRQPASPSRRAFRCTLGAVQSFDVPPHECPRTLSRLAGVGGGGRRCERAFLDCLPDQRLCTGDRHRYLVA